MAGLSYYGTGELVVSLSDECYCVAVPGLEGERVTCMCTAAAQCIDGEEDACSVDYACWGGGGY